MAAASLPLLLYVTLFYMAIFSPVHGGIFDRPEQKIIVQNSAGNEQDIWVHCFSGDDDLGTHLLRYMQVFVIRFHPSLFWNTEFFCTVTWNNIHPKGTRTQHTIVVFKQTFMDEQKCGIPGCTYFIGMNSFSGPDGINPWNHLSDRLIH